MSKKNEPDPKPLPENPQHGQNEDLTTEEIDKLRKASQQNTSYVLKELKNNEKPNEKKR